MAKKVKITGTSSFSDLNNFLNTIAPDGEMIDINPIAKIDEWISTGSYILNAALSGSIFGGMPNRRSLGLAGEEGAGKTFIALSIIRNAINKHGYQAIYMDSEGAIDETFVKRLGVDTSKVRLQPVNTIEEVNYIASQIVQQFENNDKAGLTNPKIIIALDSLGNLTSQKETTDSTEGNDKRDMTKQQAIRKLFRVNGMKFAKFGIPFIVNAHVYEKIGSYIPGKEVSGGGGLKYNVSIMLMLSKKRMEDKESEEHVKSHGIDATRIGITIKVTPIKQRFAKPIIVELHIPFYKAPNPFVGLEKFVSWDACGVLRGKMLTEKDYLKLTPTEQKSCKEFTVKVDKKLTSREYDELSKADLKLVFLDPSSNLKYIKQTEVRYAQPKDTARTLVCKHLGGETPITNLFTDIVFTQEVLEDLDNNIIKPTFQLPSIESLDDLAELTEVLDMGSELDEIPDLLD